MVTNVWLQRSRGFTIQAFKRAPPARRGHILTQQPEEINYGPHHVTSSVTCCCRWGPGRTRAAGVAGR